MLSSEDICTIFAFIYQNIGMILYWVKDNAKFVFY